MIPSLATSARSALYFGIFYLIMVSTGVRVGLRARSPFDYLEKQFILDGVRTELLYDLQSLEESFPWVEAVGNIAVDIAMRGITIGYNAPYWVSEELVLTIAGLLAITAILVFTRAWRYTTVTYIK